MNETPQAASPAAVELAQVSSRIAEAFDEHFGAGDSPVVWRAPGRVNLIGDHTDYNDGFVLPMTIDRAVYVALRRRDDEALCFYSLNFQEELTFRPGKRPEELSGWSSYVFGVVEELRSWGSMPFGFDALVYGDVPLGAGLSSSAALEVAVATAIQDLYGLPDSPVATIRLCQGVEHDYAGVQCGIMDQFASRLGRQGHALFLDCRTLQHEHVPLPLASHSIVIADSRVSRSLAGSHYNERREECRQALEHFQRNDGYALALRDVSSEMFERFGTGLPEVLRRRTRHVLTENQRVQEAANLLKSGRIEEFGVLMSASHASLRDDYEVSSPELDLLVEVASASPGVVGSRMTGGGFGGCTVNLVENEQVEALCSRLEEEYAAEFGKEPAVFALDDNLECARVSGSA